MRTLLLAFLLPLALLLAPTGCATHNPVAAADSVEGKAFAVYGSYVIAEKAAAKLVQRSETPDSVVKAIRDANRVVRPVMLTMVDLAQRYTGIRAEIEALGRAGDGQEAREALAERVAAAQTLLTELTSAYAKAKPHAEAFIAAVSSSK